MYLRKIEINCFRNFNKTEVVFQDGVNIIIGPNNSGKSNLLRAVKLLDNLESVGNIHDFNKNNIAHNIQRYKQEPPVIEIVYYIEHEMDYETFDDGILRFKNFIVYNDDGNVLSGKDGKYVINAAIRLRYELDSKYNNEYLSAMKNVQDLSGFFVALEKLISHFSWNYYNITSNHTVKKNDAQNIFSIDFVEADRQTSKTLPKTKDYVQEKIKAFDGRIDLRNDINYAINTGLSHINTDIKTIFQVDEDAIGIKNGNNEIIPRFAYDSPFHNYFEFGLQDIDLKYEIPMDSNGLGYNNLIQIYGIIKFKIDFDYNILLIEEPEAHLHPAMQYKLFQYLKALKKRDAETPGERIIKNQIFITTHSANITASADIDDMISLFYYREPATALFEVEATNLKDKFTCKTLERCSNDDAKKVAMCKQDDACICSSDCKIDCKCVCKDDCMKKRLEKRNKQLACAKNHLIKFLDVTRSDLLFTQRTILVEGLAEKLLMPAFAKKCGLDYELEYNHISIVEIGGITFNNFIPLFVGTKNKLLCFRDCDYQYIEKSDDGKTKTLCDISEYENNLATICLEDEYSAISNIKLFTQMNYGSTFENELFLDNYENVAVLLKLFNLVFPENLYGFWEKHLMSITTWNANVNAIEHKATRVKIESFIKPYIDKYNTCTSDDEKIIVEKLFFANLFLEYAKNSKGDLALSILTSDVISELRVPNYIKEGLEWLKN